MKNLFQAGALILGIATVFSFNPMAKTQAAEIIEERPAITRNHNEIDDQIYAWRDVVNHDNKDFEGFANLTVLYYEKADYAKAYKVADRALTLYEKYEISVEDDFLREVLVKGGASAYKLGKFRAAERMLTKMLSYDLKGSKDNRDTYNGLAYYYLAALTKDEGNYNQSYIYINNAIHFCPAHHIFLDFLDGFFYLHDSWYWRHSHVHYVSYIIPSYHHHHRPSYRHYYKPAPRPRADYRAHREPPRDHFRPQERIHDNRKPISGHSQRPEVHKPMPRNEQPQIRRTSVPQQKQAWGRQTPLRRTQEGTQGQVQRPMQRPIQRPQHLPQGQVHRPVQRPQQAPQGQVHRPVQRPQQAPQGQVQRPMPRPQQAPQMQKSAPSSSRQQSYRPSPKASSSSSSAKSSGRSSNSNEQQWNHGRRR